MSTHLYNSGLGRNWSEIQKSTRANLTHFYNLNGGSGTFIDLVGALDLTPSRTPAADSTSPVAGCVWSFDRIDRTTAMDLHQRRQSVGLIMSVTLVMGVHQQTLP